MSKGLLAFLHSPWSHGSILRLPLLYWSRESEELNLQIQWWWRWWTSSSNQDSIAILGHSWQIKIYWKGHKCIQLEVANMFELKLWTKHEYHWFVHQCKWEIVPSYTDHVLGPLPHETEGPWPIQFKNSHWWKRRSWSTFASHYAGGTNGASECKMDVKSQMGHVSWSHGLFSKTTSWKYA